MVAWIILICAGFFEVLFTTFLKLSKGLSDLKFSALFLLCAIISFFLLSQAIRTIPMGTAYAVWTGIGAFGTATVGILFFQEPLNSLRVFFLVLLISAVIGLKFVDKALNP